MYQMNRNITEKKLNLAKCILGTTEESTGAEIRKNYLTKMFKAKNKPPCQGFQ